MRSHSAAKRVQSAGTGPRVQAQTGFAPPVARVVQLQQAVGNRAVAQLMKRQRTVVQAAAAGNVIQRQDDYFPSGDKEPHIHIHDGGITFTAVGHSHKTLQHGDQVRENAIMEVYQNLQELGTARAQEIIDWIRDRFGIDPPEAVEEEHYEDENLPDDWVESETADHNPEGTPPMGFSFGSYTSKMK